MDSSSVLTLLVVALFLLSAHLKSDSLPKSCFLWTLLQLMVGPETCADLLSRVIDLVEGRSSRHSFIPALSQMGEVCGREIPNIQWSRTSESLFLAIQRLDDHHPLEQDVLVSQWVELLENIRVRLISPQPMPMFLGSDSHSDFTDVMGLEDISMSMKSTGNSSCLYCTETRWRGHWEGENPATTCLRSEIGISLFSIYYLIIGNASCLERIFEALFWRRWTQAGPLWSSICVENNALGDKSNELWRLGRFWGYYYWFYGYVSL